MSTRAAQADLEVLEAESALARVARPRGVGRGLMVLAYLISGGVVLPLVLLAVTVESPIPDWSVPTVLASFVSGLGLLLLYLWFEVQRLIRGE